MSINEFELLLKILHEISHELKNKLGVIGTTLNDIHEGFEVDRESIQDSLLVYNKLLFLADSLVLGSPPSQAKEKDSFTPKLEKFSEILVHFFSNEKKSREKKVNGSYLIQIKIDDQNYLTDSMEYNDSTLSLNFIKTPSTAAERIAKISLEYQFYVSRAQSLEIILIDKKTNEFLDRFLLQNKST